MNIFITGTSSGIGLALARHYLELENRVFGLSRRTPDELTSHPNYNHLSQDLGKIDELHAKVRGFIFKVKTMDLVVLNAGILPEIGDMRETSVDEMKRVMDVNLWANKVILDAIFGTADIVHQVVAISSGAAVTGSRGWNAYSLSKSALNMLIQLYAGEIPETHFSALAPGVIDTGMQEYIASLPEDERFEVVEKLKQMRGTSQMPSPSEAVDLLVEAMEYVLHFESGSFLDVRDLYYKTMQ